ncbi:DUF4265 domain-containing protein [uncultured Mucilaginibacter sp.]|uniref:DUF4265 domain-containing protein n=1 Tax=uncultured Mucilaginibacter sp. TaxID=797541 RepID=UPI0025F6DCE7|nr:DUF4265 domain-containing protein [uncultured Mucilaginibacter sp.]
MPDSNSVEILINYFSNILDDYTSETIQAGVVNEEFGYYQLKSLPIYAPGLAIDDVVWAQYKATESMLVYRKTVEHSGNSTIHAVVLNDLNDPDVMIGLFENAGCLIKKLNAKYFVIGIPSSIQYIPIKSLLDELKRKKVLDYAESCLSNKHQYKNISMP